VEPLAKDLGVTKGSFYWHFRDRADLLEAMLEEWRRRVSAMGLEHAVTFLGFRTDVPRLARAADLLVAPTRYEAYGLGVHEAICRGVPAIVTTSAGVAERYPADLLSLLLADPPAVAALAGVLRTWRSDVAGWAAKCDSFARELRSRSWDAMAAEIAALIEAV
jgi:glycosyltransferase involved in cell wall biosynthesis